MIFKICLCGLFAFAFGQEVKNRLCDNGLGECVPYYLCSNETANSYGYDILDIQVILNELCSQKFTVCCATGDVIPALTTIDPILDQKCGLRNAEGVGFTITDDKTGDDDDDESKYGEFPWMVAILKIEVAAEQTFDVYQCGGSLIHPSVVLTAAHCVQKKSPSKLKVRAGEWDTQSNNELFPHTNHEVQEIVVHKDYYKGGLYNDIALLFLKDPVKFDKHINTVCLPPQDTNFDYSRCFATGWGKDEFGKKGKYKVILKKIEVPVVPFQPCQESLRKTKLTKTYNLHNSFICAGGEPEKDTCSGDGGSPLVCPINGITGHYYQAGIVSWGIGCGENGTPGVYVNVAKFRNWIDEQLSIRQIVPEYSI